MTFQIVGYFVIEHAGDFPIIVQSVYDNVKRIVDAIRDTHTVPAICENVTFKVASDPTPTSEDSDEVFTEFDERWKLYIEFPNWEIHTLCCTDKSTLYNLGSTLSSAFPTAEVILGKYTAHRSVWKNGLLIRDFPLVPFTNVAQANWD